MAGHQYIPGHDYKKNKGKEGGGYLPVDQLWRRL